MLRLIGGASLASFVAACMGRDLGGVGVDNSSSATTDATGDASTSTSASGDGTCVAVPEETGGPYPGDGTNGPNVLMQSGIVRSDIRSSFGDYSGTAAGIPMTIKLKVVNVSDGCAALAGYAIYLWHCDRDGNYSLYTAANQNYLRGVQETDENGELTFTSIFPACYSGRWPHIHYEVYPSLDGAASAKNKIRTSQIAMPKDDCDDAYTMSGYEQSVKNLARVSLASDNVFSDGTTGEIPTLTGDPVNGYTLTLTVGVAV